MENLYVVAEEPDIAAPDKFISLNGSRWVAHLTPERKRRGNFTAAAAPSTTKSCHENLYITPGETVGSHLQQQPQQVTTNYSYLLAAETPSSGGGHKSSTDEDGYEVPLRLQQDPYVDLTAAEDATQISSSSSSSSNNSNNQALRSKKAAATATRSSSCKSIEHVFFSKDLVGSQKSNDESFLAKQLRSTSLGSNHSRTSSSASTASTAATNQQCRRLPCSPPCMSLSLPTHWQGEC